MNNFDDIAALWKVPPVPPLPDAQDIIKKSVRDRSQLARKIRIQSICMLVAIAAIIYVVIAVRFHYIITYIGLAMMFACVMAFSAIRFRQSAFLKQLDFSQAPAELLRTLEAFYTRQRWINTTGILWYTVVLNISFALYFYETIALAPFTLPWKLVIIGIYIAWMLIATLWIGKRSVKKEHAKTQKIIDQVRSLTNSLEA